MVLEVIRSTMRFHKTLSEAWLKVLQVGVVVVLLLVLLLLVVPVGVVLVLVGIVLIPKEERKLMKLVTLVQ